MCNEQLNLFKICRKIIMKEMTTIVRRSQFNTFNLLSRISFLYGAREAKTIIDMVPVKRKQLLTKNFVT